MTRNGKLIASIALGAWLLAGCSSIGLVYNRLDTVVHFEVGRYVDLDKQQQAAFDTRFDALWAWHRRTQLPVYARDLRELAHLTSAPLSVQQIQKIDEQTREHIDLTTVESLKVAAPTMAAFSDAQVADVLAAVEKRAAKENRKQQKMDDGAWRENRVREAADRLDDWTGDVTREQRQRIETWAASQKRPPPDREAGRRNQFAELLKTRAEPGFEQRLRAYAFEPFTGEAADINEPQTQASRQLLADLSAMLTAAQRARLREKLDDMAAQLDALVAAK